MKASPRAAFLACHQRGSPPWPIPAATANCWGQGGPGLCWSKQHPFQGLVGMYQQLDSPAGLRVPACIRLGGDFKPFPRAAGRGKETGTGGCVRSTSRCVVKARTMLQPRRIRVLLRPPRGAERTAPGRQGWASPLRWTRGQGSVPDFFSGVCPPGTWRPGMIAAGGGRGRPGSRGAGRDGPRGRRDCRRLP